MSEQIMDKYLRNRLSEEEKKSFEQELKNNPALNEEFVKYQQAYKILLVGNERELRLKMQEWKHKMASGNHTSPRTRYIYLALASVAACILLVFLFFPASQNPDALFEKYFTPLEVTSSRKLPTDTSLEAQVIQLYEEKDYQHILELYHAPRKNKQNQYENDLVALYAGVSALHRGEYPTAITALAEVSNQSKQELFIQAQWYLALAYLKNKQIPQAKGIFQKMTADNRHLYYQEAKKILKQLN